ncbi:MAG: MerR family transcriptional regulator [Chloroflexota bacterium]
MRIAALADQLGTTPHAIRFYERRGLLPAPSRTANRYRHYTDGDVERLRLLIGLRQLDIPLEQAAELANMCAAGHCEEVSDELRSLLVEKRRDLARRIDEMRYLDRRMAHLAGRLEAGATPRTLITVGKEEEHADSL